MDGATLLLIQRVYCLYTDIFFAVLITGVQARLCATLSKTSTYVSVMSLDSDGINAVFAHLHWFVLHIFAVTDPDCNGGHQTRRQHGSANSCILLVLLRVAPVFAVAAYTAHCVV
jgi:hypothetical protein